MQKRCVRKNLRNFQKCSSVVNKEIFVQSRNEYNGMLKRKQYLYSIEKLNNLMVSLNKSSSCFWREIRSILKPRNKVKNNIALNDWYLYFKNVCQLCTSQPLILTEDCVVYISDEHELGLLNSPITADEVLKVINRLKFKKAPGSDLVLNEMIFYSRDVISDTLLNIFQHLFNSRSFISEWQKSLITPILKKGDVNMCSNYRPIYLTSLLSKLFISILNNRLTLYVDNLDILPCEQAAFRRNFSTIDHIFSLYSLVMKQFKNNKKLYVAFIDYSRCYDSINRLAMFNVLKRYGISGNFYETLKSIYEVVFSAVKDTSTNEKTDFFDVPVGLRTGCILSPLLFNIFISEVSKSINRDGIHGVQLLANCNILHHLFYADDNCIFSTTPIGLQKKLNILYSLSERLGLSVNLGKTKVIVFRKGGYLTANEKWHYNGQPIEIVNSYAYLGITFSTRLSFTTSSMPLIAKAKKCINEILLSLHSLTTSDINVFTKLFDTKVFPILSYGSELWGIFEIQEIERVHLYALKRFLNVSLHTSNNKVYAETGRFPLSINLKIKSINYWFKIRNLESTRIVNQSYQCLLNMCNNGHNNWGRGTT